MMSPRCRHAAPAILLALAAFTVTPAAAQEEADSVDDVTMSVIDAGDANEQTFAEEIRVPGGPPGEAGAGDDAAVGTDMADDARELRDESGDRSETARDLGRDARELEPDLPGPPD